MDLSPRTQQTRISSARRESPSPQTPRRSIEVRPNVAFPVPQTSPRLLSKGRQSMDNGISCPPFISSLCRGERRRRRISGVPKPEARVNLTAGSFCEFGDCLLRSIVFVVVAFARNPDHLERGAAPLQPPGGPERSAWEEKQVLQVTRPRVRVAGFRLCPSVTLNLDRSHSVARLPPKGPVALRPDVAAGLPLSCHREGAETYCDFRQRQAGAPDFVTLCRVG